jgi:hypothetical protein
MRIWRATSRGIVITCLSGIEVNVHAKMQTMNRGPHNLKTDLLLKRSESRPHTRKNRRFMIWLRTPRAITEKTLSPSLLNM